MQLVAGRAINTTSDNHTLHNLECTIIQSRLPTPQSSTLIGPQITKSSNTHHSVCVVQSFPPTLLAMYQPLIQAICIPPATLLSKCTSLVPRPFVSHPPPCLQCTSLVPRLFVGLGQRLAMYSMGSELGRGALIRTCRGREVIKQSYIMLFKHCS